MVSYLVFLVVSTFLIFPFLLIFHCVSESKVFHISPSRTNHIYNLFNTLLVFPLILITDSRPLHIYGDELILDNQNGRNDNSMIVLNHISFEDPLLIYSLLASTKIGTGSCRIVSKSAIQYFTGPWGVCMRVLGYPFLTRTWKYDQLYLGRILKKYSNNELSVCLVSCLEGGRMNVDRLRKAKQYAAQNGLPYSPRHVLVPRTKGILSCLEQCSMKTLYDITIQYSDEHGKQMESGFLSWILAHGQVHLYVRRIRIPRNAQDVYNIWSDKDELLEYYHQNLCFPEFEGVLHRSSMMISMK